MNIYIEHQKMDSQKLPGLDLLLLPLRGRVLLGAQRVLREVHEILNVPVVYMVQRQDFAILMAFMKVVSTGRVY